jgi:RNA:NAD 2'-phosphotransferase (TPT1/KptA family)
MEPAHLVRLSKRMSLALRHAAAMARDGHVFFRSDNGVWLTDAVPPAYLGVAVKQ